MNVTLDSEQIELLRKIEAATGATASAQIRLALEAWFARHAAILETTAKGSRKKK